MREPWHMKRVVRTQSRYEQSFHMQVWFINEQ